MTYIRQRISHSRAILLASMAITGVFASFGTAAAQPGNVAQSYSHQVHEVSVTTSTFSATYRVLVTPPAAVNPLLPGYWVVSAGDDRILENDPEVITDSLPLVAIGSEAHGGDPGSGEGGEGGDPGIAGNDPEVITRTLRSGREYWFLTSTGAGGPSSASWTLLLDRFGNDPEVITYVRDMLSTDAYLGSLPAGGAWSPAASALLGTSGATFFTVDAIPGAVSPAGAVHEVSFAVGLDAAGNPTIPLMFVTANFDHNAVRVTSSSSDYRGTTAPLMTIFGLLNTVTPGYPYEPPLQAEGETAVLLEVSSSHPGYPDSSWFASSH